MGDVVGLVDWVFVVVQVQLFYCFQDGVDCVLGVVFVVGVFDVQYEFVVVVMGFQLVVQCGVGIIDVQVVSGIGGEVGVVGYGWFEEWEFFDFISLLFLMEKGDGGD